MSKAQIVWKQNVLMLEVVLDSINIRYQTLPNQLIKSLP